MRSVVDEGLKDWFDKNTSAAREWLKKIQQMQKARNEAQLVEELAQRLADKGSDEPLIVPGDVSKPEDVQNLVNQTVQRWGKIDIVIANAGFGYRAPIVDGDTERWKCA